MLQHYSAILDNPVVRVSLRQAWLDSQPGPSGGHEEGGFILHDPSGGLAISRWPMGLQNVIRVPPHSNCQFGSSEIVATFHTPPNTGENYLQEPSETDKRAVYNDSNLKGSFYIGEFVISQATVYLITPSGRVVEIGQTQELLTD